MASDERSRKGFPLFLRLVGKRVLVVGGGRVAHDKTAALIAAGARVEVVAPDIVPELEAVASRATRRPFEPTDVQGAWLVLAAAPSAVNRAVKEAADAARVFVMAVDDIESCSAFGAAQLERGALTIAISSDGRAPALVALLRRAIEAVIPAELEAWLTVAERARGAWKAEGVPIDERRPLLLRALNALYATPAPPS
jgi:siroheme synthase-like protein